MIIGVPKEVKSNEFRVGLIPAGVRELSERGHQILVETGAGDGSGYPDTTFSEAGAEIISAAQAVFDNSDLIIKVKEPQPEEYDLIREDQVVFTYFHFASSVELQQAMAKSGAVCIAYETVQKADGSLPLLTPMSEIAGRMTVQEAARFLETPQGGKGLLMGGVAGVQPANVIVLGAGQAGYQAALMAAGLQARVTLLDINIPRLRHLESILPGEARTLASNNYNIRSVIKDADVIIGTVLIPGEKAPKLITKTMLHEMKPGTLLIDVAVDQGGCMETTRPTTHNNPVFTQDNILHYGVTNMPGAVPVTATQALCQATLPYLLQIADKGWEKATDDNPELKNACNPVKGKWV